MIKHEYKIRLYLQSRKTFFSFIQSRTPQLLKNGRLSGQLRQKYRNHDNQGSINRSQEELVPMINATQFDDESEGNLYTYTSTICANFYLFHNLFGIRIFQYLLY